MQTAHGVHVGLNGIIAGFTRKDPPEQADSRTLMRHRYAKAAHEESRNGLGYPLLGVNWVDSSRGVHTRRFKLPLAYSVMIDKKHEYAFGLPLSVCLC